MNAIREVSRFMISATECHMEVLHRIMKYVIRTPERGLTFQPQGQWDRTKNFKSEIVGKSDSKYAKDKNR